MHGNISNAIKSILLIFLWKFEMMKNCYNIDIMKMKVKVFQEFDRYTDNTQNSAHI